MPPPGAEPTLPKVTFQPSGISIDVVDGQNVRQASIDANIEIASTCGGVASCGLCKVKIVDGVAGVSPVNEAEKSKLGNVFFITKERLSCQTFVHGDVTCLIPDDSADRLARERKIRDAQRAKSYERLATLKPKR